MPAKEDYAMIQKWLQRLEGLFQMPGEIWLVGDWDADFQMVGYKYYNKKILGLIVDTMSQHGFTQLVEERTHKQNGKWSCIDLIFINRKMKVTSSRNLRDEGGTHHSLVYATSVWLNQEDN